MVASLRSQPFRATRSICSHTNSRHLKSELIPDERFTDRIKWYTTPIVFGGDPNLGENVTWVTHDQHVKLVGWWNKQYRDLTPDGR
jgi:hypothetical protein